MPKIKLEMDALRVESFVTAGGAGARGTVNALSDEPATGEEDVGLLPVTDWKTCQGSECTARTLCHYTCIEACYAPGEDAFRV